MNTVTNFHGDDVQPVAPKDALFHVIPAPYEKTTSYGQGTSKGPAAILEASCQLELFDGKSIPAKHGIYTTAPVDCSGPDEMVLERISSRATKCLDFGKIPVVLGGEHTVTLGSVAAVAKKHNDFGIVHFDAHADLRDSYQNTPLSHACVMKRIHEKNIPFIQIGTRSYSYEEHKFRQQNAIPYHDAEAIFKNGVEDFALPAGFPEKIYLTFDIDAFDPSLMPATGTPVPGGLSWYQAMWLIETIFKSRICLGFDVVEFAPINELHCASFTAAQLTYNIMGYLTRSEVNRNHHKLNDDSSFNFLTTD